MRYEYEINIYFAFYILYLSLSFSFRSSKSRTPESKWKQRTAHIKLTKATAASRIGSIGGIVNRIPCTRMIFVFFFLVCYYRAASTLTVSAFVCSCECVFVCVCMSGDWRKRNALRCEMNETNDDERKKTNIEQQQQKMNRKIKPNDWKYI